MTIFSKDKFYFKRLIYSLCIALILGTLLSCTEEEREFYLLPDGYLGYIYIISGAENMPPFKYERGTPIFRIPNDGVLFIRSGLKNGFIDVNFFYEKENESREKITGRYYSYHKKPQHDPKNGLYISGPSNGLHRIDGVPCSLAVNTYYIGHIDTPPPEEYMTLKDYHKINPIDCEKLGIKISQPTKKIIEFKDYGDSSAFDRLKEKLKK